MAPLLSSAEINLLIYHYLSDSGFSHSAFSLRHEARLDSNPITNTAVVPPGQLVAFLTKGLLYRAVEEHVRPDGSQKPCSTPFRLVGPPHVCDGIPRPTSSTDLNQEEPSPSTSKNNPSDTPTATRLTPSPPPESASNPDGRFSSIGTGTSRDTKEQAAQTKTPPPEIFSSFPSKGKAKEMGSNSSSSNSASNETNPKRKASTSSLVDENPAAPNGAGDGAVGAGGGGGRDEKRLKRDREVEQSGSSSSKGKGSNPSINGIKSSSTSTFSAKGKGKSRDVEEQDESMDSPPSNPKKKESKLNGNPTGGSGKKVGGNNPNGRNGKAGAANNSHKKKNSSSSNLLESGGGGGGGDDSMESTTTGNEENDGGDETETEKELKSPKHKKGKKVSSTTNNNSTSSKPGPKPGSGRLPPDNLPPAKAVPLPPSLQTPKLTIPPSKVTALTGHSAEVFVTAWNPSVPGLIASGAGDATVRIWEVPEGSGGAIVTPTTKSKSSASVEASTDPNQKFIEPPAICKHLPSTHSKDVSTMSWNPDGTLLASGSHDGILRLWTPQGDLHLVLSMHQGPIFGVKWNRRGTEILTGSADGTAIVWDMQSGKVKQQFSLHSDSVLDVDWLTGGYSENPSLDSLDGDGTKEESGSGSRRSTLNSSEPRKLQALDSIFATGSADNSIKILRVGDSRPIRTLRGHTDEVNAIRFDPSATLLASASDDHTARIWSVGSELGVSSNSFLGGFKGNVGRRGNTPNRRENEERKRRDSTGLEDSSSASLNRDRDSSLSSSASGNIINNSNPNDELKSNSSKSNSPHPLLDDDENSGSLLNRKDPPAFSCLFVLKGHTRELYAMAWSPSSSTSIPSSNPGDGNSQSQRLLATTSFDHTCRIWNANDGACLRVIQHHNEAVYSVAWSPLGRWIATGGLDCRVFVSEVESGNVIKHYTGGGGVFDMSWRREISNSASNKSKSQEKDANGDIEMTDATNSNKSKDENQEESEEVKPSISDLDKKKTSSQSTSSSDITWNHRIAVSQGNKTLAVLDLDALDGLPG